nr:hypothetical protein [Tanacetum cinerariifolium]
MVLNSPCCSNEELASPKANGSWIKVIITEDTVRQVLRLDDAESIDCLPNEEIFAELERMGYEKPSTKLTFYKAFFSAKWNLVRNVDRSSKFYMYPRFLQLMMNAQVGDLSSHTTKYTSPALTQKVFANMRRVGKGFSRVDTPLFEGMLVLQQVNDYVADDVADDIADVVANADAEPTPPSPTPATTPSLPQQVLISSPPQVASTPPPSPHQSHIAPPSSPPPQQPPSYDATIPMELLNQLLETCATLTKKVCDLEQDKIAQDIEITKLKQRVRKLERKRKLKASGRMHPNGGKIAELDADEDVTLEEVAAAIIKDAEDDNEKPTELTKVIKVVTTAKLMTKVVITAATTITTAPSAASRRKSVVIRDHEETTTHSVIMHYEPKSKDKGKGILVEEPEPLKKQAHIEQDEAYAREGISYDDIRPIFEKHFNSIVDFLEKSEKELEEEASKAIKRKSKTSEEKAAKKKKLDEQVEELKIHLQIVSNDEDDVYTEATPFALKVPVVDYQIHTENNKPYYKIIRVDGTHQLFLSFVSLLRNFDREDLEMLWQIVQARFTSS